MLDIQPVSILSIGIPAGREGALARGGHPPVVLLVLLLCLFPAPVGSQADELFAPVQGVPCSAPLDDLTLRQRLVRIDFEQLQRARTATTRRQSADTNTASQRAARRSSAPGASASVTLNLFDDVVVRGVVERTAPTFSGGYSRSGGIVGEPLGSVTLVVNGETVAGTVRLPGATYDIESVGEGRYAIRQIEEPPLQCAVPETETGVGSPDQSDR